MLKIKELIWEITTECNNGCSYCGSSGLPHVTKNLSDTYIIEIAKKIVEYPPEEVNISGGDPTLVGINIHKQIVDMFHNANIIPKIIVNPISIIKNNDAVFINIINLYDAVGMSVNTEDELTVFNEHKAKLDMSKVTFISNFNKSNLWMFDIIYNLAKDTNRPWQVQYTMFKDESKLAIYESELAIKQFYTKLADAQNSYTKIVFGDNINAGSCTAGINTLGILASGDVVPCLSMRAWVDDIKDHIQDNLLRPGTNLEFIWQTKFKEQRFSTFKSCMEHCKNTAFRKEVQEILNAEPKPIPWKDIIDAPVPTMPVTPKYPPNDIVMVYGVQMDERGPWNIPVNIIETSDLPSWDELKRKHKEDKDE